MVGASLVDDDDDDGSVKITSNGETGKTDLRTGEKSHENGEKGENGTNDVGEKQEKKIMGVNAILIDFLLYDVMKEKEKEGQESIPHHRTRSIWY